MPASNAAVDSKHLLAIGAIGAHMLILVDIETLMNSSDIGLVEATLP